MKTAVLTVAACLLATEAQAQGIWDEAAVDAEMSAAQTAMDDAWGAKIESAARIVYWIDPSSAGWPIVWGWHDDAYLLYMAGDGYWEDGIEYHGDGDWDYAGPTFALARQKYRDAETAWNVIKDGLPPIP